MTPASVGIPLARFPEYQDHYKSVAWNLLKLPMSGFDSSVNTQISVLPLGKNSLRDAISRLLNHASEGGADLIALTTHARKGLDRFFMGSFAESLVLKSTIPLLITNPSNAWDPSFRFILYATDFAKSSNETFVKAISLAQQVSAHLTLFHRLEPENPFLPPPGFIAVQEWELRKAERQAQAIKLKEQAEGQGLKIDVDIDKKNHGVATAILDAALRHRISLIVMGARRSSDLLAMGSIPRRVLRAAPCPVLIFPTESETEE